MKSHPRISQLLVETGAFRDLDKPTILTSGELGIYYVNTEKLVQDDGKWEKLGDNSGAMVQHAVRMMEEKPTFREVINILADKTRALFPERSPGCTFAISGGQRRDWLFSGPVAATLRLPHIALYKSRSEPIDMLTPNQVELQMERLDLFYLVHVVDLITEGSSIYSADEFGQAKGWVPRLRENRGRIKDLVAVVTRLQGGEEMLAKQGLNVHSFVAIDEDFLKQHSRFPERALAYQKNPRDWSEDYLRQNGALAFVDFFNPAGGKVDRAMKFLQRYRGVLKQAGKLGELGCAVKNEYGVVL